MSKYKERTPQFFQFKEEGDEIEGVLLGVSDTVVQENDTKRYTVQTVDGLNAFLGGTQIDALLEGVEVGTQIKLQYTGTTKTASGRTLKQFRLWTQED